MNKEHLVNASIVNLNEERDSVNISNVKALYVALTQKDLPSLQRLLVKEPIWDVTLGAPDGGIYIGFEQIFGQFYPQLGKRFWSFKVSPSKFVDCGDTVIALGYYQIILNEGEKECFVRFSHTFGIDNNELIKGVWQVADSSLLYN